MRIVCFFLFFFIYNSLSAQDHYTLDGIGSWNDNSLWTPAYPFQTFADDTITITTTSEITLVPYTADGTVINNGQLTTADGSYLVINDILINNGTYIITDMPSTTEPLFAVANLINNGVLELNELSVPFPQLGIHIDYMENNGLVSGIGYKKISTEISILNNGKIDTDTIQFSVGGTIVNNDTILLAGLEFSSVPPSMSRPHVFINNGVYDGFTSFFSSMKKIENNGIWNDVVKNFISCDTFINTTLLDMPHELGAGLFINSGHYFLTKSFLGCDELFNYGTFVADSINIFGGDKVFNYGTFVVDSAANFVVADELYNDGIFECKSKISSSFSGNFDFYNSASGEVVLNDVVSADLLNFGQLTILDTSSVLTLDRQTEAGVITLSINGNAGPGVSGGHQQIQIDSNIWLIGTSILNISLNGYTPTVLDSFNLFEATNVFGEFKNVWLPEITNCADWDLQYFPDRITLYVIDSPDSDNDGIVDCMDNCPQDSLKTEPGFCGCGIADIDSDGDGSLDCFDADVVIKRDGNDNSEGVRLTGLTPGNEQSWYIGNVTDSDTSMMFMNRRNASIQFGTNNTLRMTLDSVGRLGIGKIPTTHSLEVNGQASKSTPGDWLANSDARLKTSISLLNSEETLNKLLDLQGVTYQWKTDQTYDRPSGIQFGLTAQNMQTVYPELVTTDNAGYLLTSYGTLDPMFIEGLKAMKDKITSLEATILQLNKKIKDFETLLDEVELSDSNRK